MHSNKKKRTGYLTAPKSHLFYFANPINNLDVLPNRKKHRKVNSRNPKAYKFKIIEFLLVLTPDLD